MKTYKDLKVWQVNQDCILGVANLMQALPQEYSLQHIAKQLFRSISSIGANIAEGQSSYTGKEFIRYIDIAVRSAVESDHWLATLSRMIQNKSATEQLTATNIEVIKMLKGLKKSIEAERELN